MLTILKKVIKGQTKSAIKSDEHVSGGGDGGITQQVRADICGKHIALAIGRIKRAVHGGADMSLDQGLALERELQAELFASHDALEGLTAFDHGRWRVAVDGQPFGEWEGYTPTITTRVLRSETPVTLARGPHTFSATCTGRDPRSRDHHAVFDTLRATPAR